MACQTTGNRYLILAVLTVVLAFPDDGALYGAPRFNPLGLTWARYIQKNPGGTTVRSQQSYFIKKARQLHASGYALYKRKDDNSAILEYRSALRFHATGRLYHDYANSLSNIPRLNDAVKAYKIALELNVSNPHLTLFNLACAYSRNRNRSNSFKYLKKAVSKGYTWLNYITTDRDLSYLRSGSSWSRQLDELKKIRFKALYGKAEFRTVRWGMIPWNVLKMESAPKYYEGFYRKWYTLWYRITWLGKPVLLRYRFDNKLYKLQQASYTFINLRHKSGEWRGFTYRSNQPNITVQFSDKQQFLRRQFELLKKKLVAKFGKPAAENNGSNNTAYAVWMVKDHRLTLKSYQAAQLIDLSVHVSSKKTPVRALH